MMSTKTGKKGQGPGIAEPTRRAMLTILANGGVLEEEAALSSCEVSVDSQGRLKPCVKTYDRDPQTAAEKTVATLNWLAKQLPRLQKAMVAVQGKEAK